ncbi:aspartate/glutamate racemase family protein [Flavobacterium oreochromis]|uniref:aspartate/glutamate racemase family protein n=1 Tax=Flavobacterium oreochromis TaxID=2906078 RepID=UPI001CE5A632|nr:aspartate/glutamate racemase family protein [Flavobacterium oreochromis]QYS86201.1 aspartate/glutamate racemase family protein [Flavobacterium oreochromis]
MKHKLGILGLGSFSTLHYIEELNNKSLEKFGGYNTCPFIMINTNFNQINTYLPDQETELIKNLLPYLYSLTLLNIEYLIIPNITIHRVLDKILKTHNFNFTIIHPIKLLLHKLLEKSITEVIILGSLYTMQGTYIQNLLQQNGITSIKLNKEYQKKIDNLRKLIYTTQNKNTSLLEEIIQKYPNTYFILACTELSILKYKNPHIIDLSDLQISKTIKLVNKH